MTRYVLCQDRFLTYLTEEEAKNPPLWTRRCTFREIPPARECEACERQIEEVITLECIMGDWLCDDDAEHFWDPLP